MRVTEQIDALRCLAVNPVAYLVVPRVAACMTMLPLLNVMGVAIGIIGAMICCSTSTWGVGIYFFSFYSGFCGTEDIYIGLIKSIVLE